MRLSSFLRSVWKGGGQGCESEGEDAIIRLLDYIIGEDDSSAPCLLMLRLQGKLCIRPRCILRLIGFFSRKYLQCV